MLYFKLAGLVSILAVVPPVAKELTTLESYGDWRTYAMLAAILFVGTWRDWLKLILRIRGKSKEVEIEETTKDQDQERGNQSEMVEWMKQDRDHAKNTADAMTLRYIDKIEKDLAKQDEEVKRLRAQRDELSILLPLLARPEVKELIKQMDKPRSHRSVPGIPVELARAMSSLAESSEEQ